jgi:hypothetical protein
LNAIPAFRETFERIESGIFDIVLHPSVTQSALILLVSKVMYTISGHIFPFASIYVYTVVAPRLPIAAPFIPGSRICDLPNLFTYYRRREMLFTKRFDQNLSVVQQ